MRYFKSINDGYIQTVGAGVGGIEITEAEYAEIMEVIANRPNGNYLLKSDLTWEEYTPEPYDPDDDEVIADEIITAIQEAME